MTQRPSAAEATAPDRDTQPTRRVLVVTYFFPPVGGVGVQRTLKYVTHLSRWGWRPVVLAPRDPAYPVRDPSLLSTVPREVETHRSLSLEPSRISMLAARSLRRRRPPATGGADSTLLLASGGSGSSRRILRSAASAWGWMWRVLLFPDEGIAWLPSAVLAALRVVPTRHIEAIYSSSPPASAHLIAAAVRQLTGRPWVADFRDPWVGNPFAAPESLVRLGLERRTERWIVKRADRVILAMDALRELFVARYPDLAAKFVYIPNGYDRADLQGLPPAPASEPGTFRLVFAGSLYRAHELEVFLEGIERLFSRRPALRSRLRVDFVGRVNDANARIAASLVVRERLQGVVTFVGFVPRPAALARMGAADALLQLMPADAGADVFVGGKLLEYLAFDRPILAMMPPGEGRRFVESLPNGRTADVDASSVADAIERLLDDPPPAAAGDPSGRYDRVNLAGELARVLDDAVSSPRQRLPSQTQPRPPVRHR